MQPKVTKDPNNRFKQGLNDSSSQTQTAEAGSWAFIIHDPFTSGREFKAFGKDTEL